MTSLLFTISTASGTDTNDQATQHDGRGHRLNGPDRYVDPDGLPGWEVEFPVDVNARRTILPCNGECDVGRFTSARRPQRSANRQDGQHRGCDDNRDTQMAAHAQNPVILGNSGRRLSGGVWRRQRRPLERSSPWRNCGA